MRDARIAMIYKGANGIQALDLVGRKLAQNGGRALQSFFTEVNTFCKENKDREDIGHLVRPVIQASNDLQGATMWLMQNAMANPDNAGAGSTDFMHCMGLVALGYMWLKIADAASTQLKAGANGKTDFMENKLTTAQFFMERVMPESSAHLARIKTGSETMMSMPVEAF